MLGIIWRTRFRKFVSQGRWRKFIPGKSWIVRFPGVDSRVSGNQSKLPLVLEREKERESSIVSRSLPKCRYSRLVQRCLVLFAISVHSVKRGRSIHETVLAAIFRIPGSTTPPGKFLYSSFRRGTTTISRLFLSFFHYSSISFHQK